MEKHIYEQALVWDLVARIVALGKIDCIRGTREERGLVFDARTDDATMIINAVATEEVPEFQGVFGFGNLKRLAALTKTKAYTGVDAGMQVAHTKEGEVESLRFFNEGASIDNYRVMDKSSVDAVSKTKNRFKHEDEDDVWSIKFDMDDDALARFKEAASLYSDSRLFTPVLKDGALHFAFGNASFGCDGTRLVKEGVEGEINDNVRYPIAHTLGILRVAQSATISISKRFDLMKIECESPIAKYQYFINGTA